MKAGILAMQGAYHKHRAIMESLGFDAVEVREPHELSSVNGLIIPGGESTVMVKLLARNGIMYPEKQDT